MIAQAPMKNAGNHHFIIRHPLILAQFCSSNTANGLKISRTSMKCINQANNYMPSYAIDLFVMSQPSESDPKDHNKNYSRDAIRHQTGDQRIDDEQEAWNECCDSTNDEMDGASRKASHASTGTAGAIRPLPFPYKLHHMLEDVEKCGKEDVVSWMPNGSVFKVHKPAEFINHVVPKYFNLTKYKSFKRQLLNYGFTRLDESIDDQDIGEQT